MLKIDFIRAENGKLSEATCTTPDGKMRIDGGYNVNMPKGRGVSRVGSSDGLIYRMIVALADRGFAGERFEAHDGRIVCLRGVIDKKSVPVSYGGEKKRDDRI